MSNATFHLTIRYICKKCGWRWSRNDLRSRVSLNMDRPIATVCPGCDGQDDE